MQEAWIFNREMLISHHRDRLVEWGKQIISTLENMQRDRNLKKGLESIAKISEAHEIAVETVITTNYSPTSNQNARQRTHSIRLKNPERMTGITIFEIDEDLIDFQKDNIEGFERLVSDIENHEGAQNNKAIAIAHSIERNKNARSGFIIKAFDPVIWHALSCVTAQEYQVFMTRKTMTTPFITRGRIPVSDPAKYLQNVEMLKMLLKGEITTSQTGQVIGCGPLDHFSIRDFHDELRPHERARGRAFLNGNTLRVNGEYPDTILYATEGQPLDEFFEFWSTKGLGLKILEASRLSDDNNIFVLDSPKHYRFMKYAYPWRN